MRAMQPKSHVWRVNGLDHHVLEWGSSAGPVALVVHGFQNAAASWDDVAVELASAGFRVLAPDMRGFGDGARVPPGAYYYFPDYVSDIAGIVSAHASDAPLFLIGHSMGATVATYFAGAFPERVTKLALIDGVGPPDNPSEVAPARMRRWIETAFESGPPDRKPMTRADALGRLMRFNPTLDEAVLSRRLDQLSREVDGGLVWKADPLHATMSPLPFFGASYRAFARNVTCPALYVSGGAMGFHVPDEEERLACFPKLEKVTIDAGHALHWARPKELAETLVAFWRG
jgi:pimeloyl-ACP methyl ester carboxylesterase